MRKYETVVILDPTFSEKQMKEEAEKVKKILDENGAQEMELDFWGKREIAYPVKKHSHGWYVCFYCATEDSRFVNNITELLRISEPVVLYQIHRINDRARKFKGRVHTKDGVVTKHEEYVFG
ncbi:30S ribosomal protein S6 [Oligoflexia bacterium]|nr:30S ribosomal protein S6 [Oligoflexia bacterium]